MLEKALKLEAIFYSKDVLYCYTIHKLKRVSKQYHRVINSFLLGPYIIRKLERALKRLNVIECGKYILCYITRKLERALKLYNRTINIHFNSVI